MGIPILVRTQIARFMGPTCGHLGPVGPRWAPCWPHEPCYQGTISLCWNNLPGLWNVLNCSYKTAKMFSSTWWNVEMHQRRLVCTEHDKMIYRIRLRRSGIFCLISSVIDWDIPNMTKKIVCLLYLPNVTKKILYLLYLRRAIHDLSPFSDFCPLSLQGLSQSKKRLHMTCLLPLADMLQRDIARTYIKNGFWINPCYELPNKVGQQFSFNVSR